MWIISQDGREAVNTANLQYLGCETTTDGKNFVVARLSNNEKITLGFYESSAIAEKVLKQVINTTKTENQMKMPMKGQDK